MRNNPFNPKFQSLPATLPIFPLPGAIVMPGAQLPLNIFEPRYLEMVQDALGEARMIGMVQPASGSDAEADAPEIYQTGCAGRITSFSETHDGRIILVLTGVCRFDVEQELRTDRTYRRVAADWRRFDVDYQDTGEHLLDRQRFANTLRHYGETNQVELPWDDLRGMKDGDLVNLLASHLPLPVADKQAMVEAVTSEERARLMQVLLDFHLTQGSDQKERRH